MVRKNDLHIKKEESWKMFNSIASTYDILNSILSVGILKVWRNKLVSYLPKGNNLSILDCATGTGEVMFSIMKKRKPDVKTIIGIDLAQKMMDKGEVVKNKLSYTEKMKFQCADATKIPYEEGYFDCVTMAFGIRNVDNPQQCLDEIHRVLKPNGVALIMECSVPQNPIVKWLYLIYFRHVLPFIGGIVSGDSNAYRYLNKTVETFPAGQNFIKLMTTSHFDASFERLTLGITTLYIGRKKSNDTN